ncbi:MAG: hypothetical protein HYX67_01815 [Candidatus Melainabacteria bacterium]|nr:hypothetical protein [Candidatus Melainabacteria bacterium]
MRYLSVMPAKRRTTLGISFNDGKNFGNQIRAKCGKDITVWHAHRDISALKAELLNY